RGRRGGGAGSPGRLRGRRGLAMRRHHAALRLPERRRLLPGGPRPTPAAAARVSSYSLPPRGGGTLLPSPLAGEGQGGGAEQATTSQEFLTPPPRPSPARGEGERQPSTQHRNEPGAKASGSLRFVLCQSLAAGPFPTKKRQKCCNTIGNRSCSREEKELG